MMRTTQKLQHLLHRQGIKLIDQPTAEAMAPGTLTLILERETWSLPLCCPDAASLYDLVTLENYTFSQAVQIFRQILLNVMSLLSVAWSPKLIYRPFYHRLSSCFSQLMIQQCSVPFLSWLPCRITRVDEDIIIRINKFLLFTGDQNE